jgi:hypothetical protein
VIILDFCKNTAFFAQQVKNLAPSSPATLGDGHIIEKPKEPTYLAAQYIYAIWLIAMMLKALIGIRANLEASWTILACDYFARMLCRVPDPFFFLFFISSIFAGWQNIIYCWGLTQALNSFTPLWESSLKI